MEARAGVVGDDIEGDGRLAVGLADEAEDAGEREVVHVVGGVVAVGPVLAETRERAVDQPRVDRGEGRPVAPEARHHARPKALEDDVRRRRQAVEERPALRGLEVESDAPLVAVDEREGRPPRVLDRRLRRLDLDDVGAHVGEEHRAELARRHPHQLEDPDPVEGPHARSLLAGGAGVNDRSRAPA